MLCARLCSPRYAPLDAVTCPCCAHCACSEATTRRWSPCATKPVRSSTRPRERHTTCPWIKQDHEASFAETLLAARDDGPFAPTFTLLAHVAQGAAPLFRRTLSSYGVSAGDFVGRGDEGPYGKPLQEVAGRFGVEHDAYLRHTGEDRLTLVPTHPTAILIGDGTPDDAALLRYRFARMFECARPAAPDRDPRLPIPHKTCCSRFGPPSVLQTPRALPWPVRPPRSLPSFGAPCRQPHSAR